MRVSRRSLIRGLLLALGAAPPGLPARLGQRPAEAAGREAAAPGEGAASAGALSPRETEDLLAFGELLVEGRPLPAAERAHLLEHVEDRARHPSGHYLSLYRATVGVLGRLAGAPFSSLPVERRLELIARHRLGTVAVGPDEDLAAIPEEVREVRTRAGPDLVGGYYNSPAGWAIVGYSAFPGRCGDLERYTRPVP